jgi:hypothetical protein
MNCTQQHPYKKSTFGRKCNKLNANAGCQITVNLCKKDGRWAQNSSVGRKLLYKIHARANIQNFIQFLFYLPWLA